MSIFKSYDIRGRYPEEVNEAVAYKVGRAFVTFTSYRHLLVGQDCRLSSPSMAKALIDGLTDQGADVDLAGMQSTPLLDLMQAHLKYDAVLVVTASHMGRAFNGIKMYLKGSRAINAGYGMADIERLVGENRFSSEKKGRVARIELMQAYTDVIVKQFRRPFSKVSVVLDASNGAKGPELEHVMNALDVAFHPLNFTPDGTFPAHEPNPMVGEGYDTMERAIRLQHASCGAMFDGDGDRIMLFDELGKPVRNDFTLALLASIVLHKHPGAKIIHDLLASKAVPEAIRAAGGVPVRVRVGYSFARETLVKEGCFLGGESSGHFFEEELLGSGNVLYVLFTVLGHLHDTGKPLSSLVRPFAQYASTGVLNVEVESASQSMAALEKEFEGEKKDRLDGLTVEMGRGWFVVRPSHTEDGMLRVIVEGADREAMESLRDRVLAVVGARDRPR